jgi:protein SCO1/2
MANANTPKWLIPVGLVLIFGALLGIGTYQVYYNPKPARILPTYGSHPKDTNAADSEENRIVHTVPFFEFYDQNGNPVNQTHTDGKTYVADFFFTTCQTICPVMSKQMGRLAKEFKSDTSVRFLSHTVDPETDSIPNLLIYAREHQADDSQWSFLTGSKKELYKMARDGYFVTATEGDGGADDFVHTENFVLIDKYRQIRGYYNGTDSVEMGKLIRDIRLLKEEYTWRDRR